METNMMSITACDNVTGSRVELVRQENGIDLYEVRLEFADPAQNACTAVSWHEKMKGILAYWSPTAARDRSLKQWYAPRCNVSSFAQSAPVCCLFSHDGQNYRTVAVSEAEKPVKTLVSVNDFAEKEELDFSVVLFEKNAPPEKEYRCYIRIDRRELPMAQCIREASEWCGQFYPPIAMSENAARTCDRPLYSSWYACHQHPDQATLEKEIELAARMGFKSLIIDDGWSYDGPGTGDYYDCGTWSVAVSKFPDFRAFMEKAHALGIKVALWFPVPFVGRNNPDYPKYESMLLRYDSAMRAGVLDPRYPAVRSYILNAYREMVDKYALDGLKLDFIDSFKAENYTFSPDMDCVTVEQGIGKLLGEIGQAFTARNPDFMIEFRQNYTGPSITRYCNMLRAGDCPFDVLSNRLRTLDVRMNGYPLAVHADMYYWAHDEDPKLCARMMLNTLFAVPQVSVLLAQSSEMHLRVIEHYIRWWDAHRETLLHGDMTVRGAEMEYTYAEADDGTQRIGVLYAPGKAVFDGKKLTLFNAAAEETAVLECTCGGKAIFFDYIGTKTGECLFEAGERCIRIPSGGRVEISA